LQTKTKYSQFLRINAAYCDDENHSADLRLEALAALPNGLRHSRAYDVHVLCANVDASKPVMMRSAAVWRLGKSKLNEEQLLALSRYYQKRRAVGDDQVADRV